MEQDQDELVAMIFGDHPPENWRDNPEFRVYLAEMGAMSVDRIAGEQGRVGGQLRTLQQQAALSLHPETSVFQCQELLGCAFPCHDSLAHLVDPQSLMLPTLLP